MAESKAVKNEATWRAITGLICGSIALLLFWIPGIAQVFAILSHIFSGIAVAKKEKLGVLGLVLGLVSWIPFCIFFLVFVGSALSTF